MSWQPHFLPPNQFVCPDSTVETLLIENSSSWDHDLVKSIIPPFVSERIYTLPLLSREVEDHIVWQGIKSEYYSVKSGYHTALALFRHGDNAESSNTAETRLFLFQFWNLKLPNKVTNFRRRACTESLPTKRIYC